MAEQLWVPHNKDHAQFKTGARPTPTWKIAQAVQSGALRVHKPRPVVEARPLTVPSFLEMWLNDQYGDCVSAESAAAIAFYSVMLGLPEAEVTDAAVKAFCNKFNVLNGADLMEVCQDMQQTGMQGPDGSYIKEGPAAAVDFASEPALQGALEEGPVKIAIDSSALPSGAGNQNGWSASGGGNFGNTDHCVGVWNYGKSADLFSALKATKPAGFPATGYHLYTWSTVGVVDHAWLMGTCVEAYLRTPTTVGLGPPPPPPPAGNSLVLTEALAPGAYSVPGVGTLTVTQAVPPGTYAVAGGGTPGSFVLLSALPAGSYSAGGASLAVPVTVQPGTYPFWTGTAPATLNLLAVLCSLYRTGMLAWLPAKIQAVLAVVCAMTPSQLAEPATQRMATAMLLAAAGGGCPGG